jgi:hypothetical protein
MDKEIIHKELDLIQDVIKRMANNSFEVKKWLIGILTAIAVFKHEELLGGNSQLVLLLLVPVLCFWYLDSYFLSVEKQFREMYHWVIQNRSFTSEYLYDLKTMERKLPSGGKENFMKRNNGIWQTAVSKTIWPFYIVPVIFIITYSVLQCYAINESMLFE